MDDAALRDRVRESMFGWWRVLGSSSEGARAIERSGLLAAVIPAAPERSVFNSVLYSDGAALADSLEELARAYEQAGVRAWTVWVPEEDAETLRVVEDAGHVLDGEPRAMAVELAGVEEPDLEGVDWSGEAELETLARVNDAAYGWPAGTFGAALGDLPRDRLHVYESRVDGEVVATMMTVDFDRDTEVAFVATLPDARGRGLATALMRRSLWDARGRGSETATLQATRLGRPVYERVGFRDLGAFEMWERRRS